MSTRFLTRSSMALFAAGLFATSAWAHHGWSWADAEQIQLSGTVKAVQIAPPHPTMDIETANDGVWRVELGNPSQTQRSGFVEGSAKVGDTITATGNRAEDHAEKRMKAVQVTVGGKTYDIYPERIQAKR
ncbi:DUF6152 family protein [Alcaligenaceae bacterium B3P038]|nr:DUF6152 family protein [Alcaligenaceae bacterium B3P038]